MKSLFFCIFLFLSTAGFSQSDSSKYFQKVATLDSIMYHLYDVISGEAGEERDWDLFRFLFAEDATLIPSGYGKDGVYKHKRMTPEEYIEQSGPILLKKGFFEQELHRQEQVFGNIAHVFTSYECFKSKDDQEPFMRGINSVQLVFSQNRWWIVNIYWAQETPDTPLPKKFNK